MEVLNELLGYPNIKIYQETDAFNFSIDSMILADFASIKYTTKKIIDLGTGNAPIPLYLTLRTKEKIVGVEIQKKSFELAVKSVKINSKEEQISLINDNIINISSKVGCGKFDLVISNPPYFKYKETSITNKNDELTIARHEVLIDLDQLCHEAALLLNNGGSFCLVHRPDRIVEIFETLRKYGLEPKRLQLVYPKPNCDANHVLIEALKSRNSGGLKCLSPLFIHNEDGTHTKEVLKIYNKEKEW